MREAVVIRNDKGMTLIEVLIAMTLLAIAFTGLIQSMLVAINTNVMIELREDAVAIADQRMTELRNTPFPVPPATNDLSDTPPSGVVEASVTRMVRSVSQTFTLARTITPVTANSKQVVIIVGWNYRGANYQHTVSTVIRGQ